MSRFSRWIETTLQRTGQFNLSVGYALDLGSVQTKIAIQQTIVFQQPTCVAIHRKSGSVVAIGQAAADLLGKTPAHIEVIFPVRRGKIQDIAAAQLFLRLSLESVRRQRRLWHPHIFLAVPAQTSAAEKEMLRKLFREINYPRVSFVTQLEAAYHHLQEQKKVGRVFALVNIGGTLTEMAFFAQGERVTTRTLQLGGNDFTQVILREVQKLYHCQIGWQTAEKVKINLGVDISGQKNKKMIVRGRDILSSLPATVQISSGDFTAGFQPLIDDLIQNITDLFQSTAPEVMSEGLDQGVMLSGGGSLLAGLPTLIENELRSAVHVSPTAIEDVVLCAQPKLQPTIF